MSPALHEFIANYGLWAVLGGTLLEGESVVVFAGFLAHQHLLRLPGVMLCAFAGSLIADQALFYLGRRWRDHRLVLRLRAKPAFAKALAAVDRHPDGFILSLRFLYGLRTVGPIALGVSNVPAPRFLVLNVVAAAIWAVCFSLLGYLFDRPSSRCWAAAWRRNQARGRAGRGGGGVAGPSLAGETPPLMKRKAPCLTVQGDSGAPPHTSNLPPTRNTWRRRALRYQPPINGSSARRRRMGWRWSKSCQALKSCPRRSQLWRASERVCRGRTPPALPLPRSWRRTPGPVFPIDTDSAWGRILPGLRPAWRLPLAPGRRHC